MESNQEMQVKREVRDVCMPMGLVYKALVKAGQLKSGQEKEEKMNRENHGSFYPRVSRIPHDSTRDDEQRRDGGTKCERFVKKSSQTLDYLLSKGRSASDK